MGPTTPRTRVSARTRGSPSVFLSLSLSLSRSLFSLYFFQSSVDIVRAFQFHQGLITGKNLKWPVADVSLGFFQAAMIRFNLGTYFPCRDSRVASEQMLAEQIQISVICHSLLLFSISLSISFSFFLSFPLSVFLL